ncbi:MAG TPA: hypothetical protein VFZ66_22525 [Herpetosiphonaceae bacterium]
MEQPFSRPVPTIAQLVDRLFKENRHPSGREYSYREVALAMQGEVGYSSLQKIRTGENTNPTYRTLLALCIFFGKPPLYFFPDLWDHYDPSLWDEFYASLPE